jgi:hypothetical protein
LGVHEGCGESRTKHVSSRTAAGCGSRILKGISSASNSVSLRGKKYCTLIASGGEEVSESLVTRELEGSIFSLPTPERVQTGQSGRGLVLLASVFELAAIPQTTT